MPKPARCWPNTSVMPRIPTPRRPGAVSTTRWAWMCCRRPSTSHDVKTLASGDGKDHAAMAGPWCSKPVQLPIRLMMQNSVASMKPMKRSRPGGSCPGFWRSAWRPRHSPPVPPPPFCRPAGPCSRPMRPAQGPPTRPNECHPGAAQPGAGNHAGGADGGAYFAALQAQLGARGGKGQVRWWASIAAKPAPRLEMAQAEYAQPTKHWKPRTAAQARCRRRCRSFAGHRGGQGAAAIAVSRAQLAQCAVTAPFTGRVVKVHVKPHQGVNVGAPLVDLISEGPLKLRLNVPSRWLRQLQDRHTFRGDDTMRPGASLSGQGDGDQRPCGCRGADRRTGSAHGKMPSPSCWPA